MRQYLAIQEMESGKSLGGNFLGRNGLMPYGSGNMIMGGDHGPQGKVGEYNCGNSLPCDSVLTLNSHSSSFLSIAEHWIMETNWSKCHGFNYLLLAG